MRQKRKLFLNLFTFGVIFMLFGCSEELYNEYTNSDKHSILVQRKNFDDLKKNKKLMKSIEKFTLKSSNSIQRQHYDSINNFYIDLDNVMYTLDSLQNQTYTFKVNRIPNNGQFENLILKTSKTGDFDAILVQYNQNVLNLNSNNSQEILNSINQNVTFTYLGKKSINEINSKFMYNEECYEPGFVYVAGHSCASGQHSFADGAVCTYWGTTDMATSGGYVYTMIPVSCDGGGGGGGELGDGFSTGPHGGGGGSDPLDTPCTKVKKPFTKVPSLKQRTQTLAGQTSQPTEKGFYMCNNATSATTNPFTNLSNGTSGSIELPANVSAPMLVIAHTHNSPATSTYSVPSWEDLDEFSKYIQENPTFVDSENLVFIVITADGTRYALTINNIELFKDFFYWPKFDIANYDYSKLLRKNNAMTEYYYGIPNANPPVLPKIKENSTSNSQDLKHFLNMLQVGGAGVDVFEINSTYSTFTQVTYNPNTDQIIRTNCN